GRGNLTIDAWVRSGSLEPLKKGEMMVQFIPPTTTVAGAQLALDKPPRVVIAQKEIPVRAHRDDKEKPIGAVEVGAEVYLLETITGWVNVLPRNLGLTPADDGGFWIPASDAPRCSVDAEGTPAPPVNAGAPPHPRRPGSPGSRDHAASRSSSARARRP